MVLVPAVEPSERFLLGVVLVVRRVIEVARLLDPVYGSGKAALLEYPELPNVP